MNSAVMIGNLNITPFEKNHDAADPCSFIVEGNGVKVGVFTDIGKICKPLIHHFKQCHAVFLESNYDEQMLAEGSYPMHLKKRIAGGKGHLSNNQALELFITHRATYLSHLILSHLSKENNHPEKVQQLFNFHAQRTKIIVASRHHETEVYRIAALPTQVPKTQPLTMPLPVVQMSLFS